MVSMFVLGCSSTATIPPEAGADATSEASTDASAQATDSAADSPAPKLGGSCSMNDAYCVDSTTEGFCVAGVYQPVSCSGSMGCYIQSGYIYCDQSLGVLGDPCKPADNHTCATSHKSELLCSVDDGGVIGTWVLQRSCPDDGGCSIMASQVYCY
jgi:hypothetical protein